MSGITRSLHRPGAGVKRKLEPPIVQIHPMAENEDEQAPAVELGAGEAVEGAPLARISSRLTWGVEKSEVARREGDTTIRTSDGPQSLGDILDEVDMTYFATRQEFEQAVREVIGWEPVQTAE